MSYVSTEIRTRHVVAPSVLLYAKNALKLTDKHL